MTNQPKTSENATTLQDLLKLAENEFGDDLVGSHISKEGLYVRVVRDVWADLASWLKHDQGFTYFNFLSAIDWLPSPFGRGMDSTVDNAQSPPDPNLSKAAGSNQAGKTQANSDKTTGSQSSKSSQAQQDNPKTPVIETGVAGGDTRFQLLACVNDVNSHRSVIAKADLPDGDLNTPSWVPTYPGANWHEREAWEMFGIDFSGHPGLRHLYLPGDFEGNPLRKDYPLLARRVKPWPGIVDVELIPDKN